MTKAKKTNRVMHKLIVKDNGIVEWKWSLCNKVGSLNILNRNWKNVTCKRCLKMRGKK